MSSRGSPPCIYRVREVHGPSCHLQTPIIFSGGWTNPSEKYELNWIISPNTGKWEYLYLKLPTMLTFNHHHVDFIQICSYYVEWNKHTHKKTQRERDILWYTVHGSEIIRNLHTFEFIPLLTMGLIHPRWLAVSGISSIVQIVFLLICFK